MSEKTKVLVISDHYLAASGVGTQTKYLVDHLLKTGKYKFWYLGGAMKHTDYRLQRYHEWGDDLTVMPVDGYGNHDMIRQLLREFKPDVLWFMTDPRFYHWLWEIEDEIRCKVPMIYYHVWDNKPYPMFNKPHYLSNDVIVTISKLTDDIVKHVAPEVESHYLPHSVDINNFKKLPIDIVSQFRKKVFPKTNEQKFTVFWNSRNARRKNPGSVIWWFNDFLNIVGKDKARLLMHTDPKDQHGPDLEAIISELGLTNGEVMFSVNKLNPPEMALMYNICDVTVALSDAEGFGLSCLESLSCETPVIVTMTGGLQEQVTDGEKWFGVGLPVVSQMIVGSQDVPFIYEDRVAKEDFVNGLLKIFNLSAAEKEQLGKDCRQHVEKNYNPETLMKKWEEIFEKTREKRGSWSDRKQYNKWTLKEIE